MDEFGNITDFTRQSMTTDQLNEISNKKAWNKYINNNFKNNYKKRPLKDRQREENDLIMKGQQKIDDLREERMNDEDLDRARVLRIEQANIMS